MGVIVISLWSTSMGIKVTICISICILAIISVVAKISTLIFGQKMVICDKQSKFKQFI